MYTILYVEDDLWDYQSLIDVLATRYTMITAREAGRALQTIREFAETGRRIDLIILDVSLPYSPELPDTSNGKTSGVEFARVVLQELKVNIPIICYTSNNNLDVYRQLTNLGIQDIVSKTKGIRDLMDVIQKYLP